MILFFILSHFTLLVIIALVAFVLYHFMDKQQSGVSQRLDKCENQLEEHGKMLKARTKTN